MTSYPQIVQSLCTCATHNHFVHKWTLNHLASVAKWLSAHLWTKWLWVRVQLQSLKLQISHLLWARSSLTFRQLWSVYSLWKAYVTWKEHTVPFYLIKAENRTKKSLTQLSDYCFEWRYHFCQKMLIFCKKKLTFSKLREPWYNLHTRN